MQRKLITCSCVEISIWATTFVFSIERITSWLPYPPAYIGFWETLSESWSLTSWNISGLATFRTWATGLTQRGTTDNNVSFDLVQQIAVHNGFGLSHCSWLTVFLLCRCYVPLQICTITCIFKHIHAVVERFHTIMSLRWSQPQLLLRHGIDKGGSHKQTHICCLI